MVPNDVEVAVFTGSLPGKRQGTRRVAGISWTCTSSKVPHSRCSCGSGGRTWLLPWQRTSRRSSRGESADRLRGTCPHNHRRRGPCNCGTRRTNAQAAAHSQSQHISQSHSQSEHSTVIAQSQPPSQSQPVTAHLAIPANGAPRAVGVALVAVVRVRYA